MIADRVERARQHKRGVRVKLQPGRAEEVSGEQSDGGATVRTETAAFLIDFHQTVRKP